MQCGNVLRSCIGSPAMPFVNTSWGSSFAFHMGRISEDESTISGGQIGEFKCFTNKFRG